MIYISSFTFSIIIDILFYNDNTMRKLVEDNGKFNLKYKLPRIIISDIAKTIFSFILECLIDYQDKLIDLKNNLGVIDKENIKSNNSKNNTYIGPNKRVIVSENKIDSTYRSLYITIKSYKNKKH
jgi:hypothetical protein